MHTIKLHVFSLDIPPTDVITVNYLMVAPLVQTCSISISDSGYHVLDRDGYQSKPSIKRMLSYLSKSMNSGANQSSRHSIAKDKSDSPSMDEESAQDTPHADSEREQLKGQISALFKTVWDGLYQTHEAKGPFHTEEIMTLYRGAGMICYPTSKESFAGVKNEGEKNRAEADDDDETDDSSDHRRRRKNRRPRVPYPLIPLTDAIGRGSGSHREGPSTGVQIVLDALKVWEESSLESLAKIVEVLKAYESEIKVVEAVYAFLREKQVGLREPTVADERAMVEGLKALELSACARRLKHYGARMGVLGMDMKEEVREVVKARNEAIEEENEREGRRGKGKKPINPEAVLSGGVVVRETVYPRMRMKGSGMLSGTVVGSAGW